jgi:hypothetical protein
MVRLSSIGHAHRVLAVLSLLAVTACGDAAVSPTAGAGDPSLAKLPLIAQASQLHTGKYHDSSLPHATGRSGSARLAARALAGADGVTHLLVTTGSVDDPDHAPGELSKVQIKAWGPDGEKLFTENFQRFTTEGSYVFELYGLPAGSRIQVQANVRGIDRNRTDVVTITETVKLAAAFSTTIHLPPQVVVGVPTVITATVRETNGQVGGTTRCVLYVDGVVADYGNEVWVDAGGEVTCAFTTRFTTTGNHDVRVVLQSTDPTNTWNNTPPSSSGTVSAIIPNPNPTWQANVSDRTVTSTRRYDLHWWNPNGSHKEYEQSNSEAPRSQSISVSGTLARATVFPLASVQLAVSSNAAGTFQTASWAGLLAGLPDLSGQSCVNQMVPEQGGHFTLCSTGIGATGSTTFGYTRFAGTVTYHSRGFSRTWDGVAGTENYWTWNENPTTYAGGGQMRSLGTSVGIQISVGDGFGSFTINAAMPLTSFDNLLSEEPYTCRDESPYWLDGGVQTICEGFTERETGVTGHAAG